MSPSPLLLAHLRLLAAAHQPPCPCSPQVEKMAQQFGVQEDVSYTCETAGHFWLLHLLSR